MGTNKNFIVDAVIGAALLLVGAAGYYFSPQLLPKSDVTATPEAGCDLQRETCGAAIPSGGRIELSMTPRPIPNLQPLDAEVRIDGRQAGNVMLDLAGTTMNMGLNRTSLVETSPGRFSGTTSLPVCVTGAMAWRATVTFESGRERISAPFQFNSSPH